jgi:hypothetical protein
LRAYRNFATIRASTKHMARESRHEESALGRGARAAVACLSAAQQPTAGNLEKLSEFKTTSTPMDIPHVPQTGATAGAIKEKLARIKLPDGFKIGLYAIVPDARHIAVGPRGVVTFVGTP